jgi:hypothetical protein
VLQAATVPKNYYAMTSETPPPAAAPEPFDVWWPRYLKRVDDSALAAERHLEIPAGTISSIPNDPDFIATVKTYAVVEPLLNDLIASWPTQPFGFERFAKQNENFRTFVTKLNISGNTGKLRLAEGLDLLPGWQVLFIQALARVRNRYAHNVKNMHRSLTEILTEEQQDNQRIVTQLTGMEVTQPWLVDNGNYYLKLLMYHNLTHFLAGALHTLRPPPQPGGLLGALLAGASIKPGAPHSGPQASSSPDSTGRREDRSSEQKAPHDDER